MPSLGNKSVSQDGGDTVKAKGTFNLINPRLGSPYAAFELTPVRSKPTHEKQYDEDDQDADAADAADAAVPEAVAVTAEAATEATKQEELNRIEPLGTPTVKPLSGIFPYYSLNPLSPALISMPVRHLS